MPAEMMMMINCLCEMVNQRKKITNFMSEHEGLNCKPLSCNAVTKPIEL